MTASGAPKSSVGTISRKMISAAISEGRVSRPWVSGRAPRSSWKAAGDA